MKEKVYVDRLFADYEDTPEIKDFKEEITANLAENIRALVSKGHNEEEAFEKATAELGDITAIADGIGKKKRNEAIGQMYISAKVPFSKKTAAGLTIASGLLLLAAGAALVTFFTNTPGANMYYVAAVILSIACGLYTYFGLTQETAAHYAMKRKRAIIYGIICFVAFLGAALATVAFFSAGLGFPAAVTIKSVFIIPAATALIFMRTTETKRQKPWLKAMVEREIENSMQFHKDMVNPLKAARFGVLSGGLWVLSAAVFITLHFALSLPYAWIVALFTLAIQVFMVAMIFEKNK